jgi:hypothetical protein
MALIVFGLAVLVGQLLALYGVGHATDVMVRIGLAGTALLTTVGAVSFSAGCLLAAAPRTTVRHATRIARGLKRR